MEADDVTYLAQEIKKAEKLSIDDLNLLRSIEIQLIHNVPLQHQIGRCSRGLSKEDVEKFEKIIPIKRGVYNPSEDEIIVRNWKTFCKLHKWDYRNVRPFLLLRNDDKMNVRGRMQRQRFVQFLANGLENRTLYSVYHRFRNLYEEHLQGRFDPDEDEMIINHLEKNTNLDEKRKYADLAKVLHRTRGSIWRRYMLLKKKREEQL